MAILLMVMLVGMMLSSLLVPMIITADRTTRFDITRVQALDAAQSGIDVTLGVIRAAVNGTVGDSSKLPCGPLTGTVNTGSVAEYSVVVEYFTFDPVKLLFPAPAPDAVNGRMYCVAGYGTYSTGLSTITPSFARFTSTGTVGTSTNGSTAGRTLTATYVFRTSNVNIPGGTVQISGAPLCMDVGSPTAPTGTPVTLQPCTGTVTGIAPGAQQVFAYRTDLTLQLSSSVTTVNPNGLCLNSTSTPAASGNAIKLSQCAAVGSPSPYTEQWSYNDNGQYQAAQADSATTGKLPDLCMNVSGLTAGLPVVLGGCGSGWVPSPAVGSGAATRPTSNTAGISTSQWVNYYEFGRCLDVTNQLTASAFLIDFPCKQNPFPAAKTWNQLFAAPTIPAGQTSVTGLISTNNGAKFCLTMPASTAAPAYVTVKTCDGSAGQNWTIYGGDVSLSYSTMYTIVNGTGTGALCLGLGTPTDLYATWSKIDVERCDGSTEQKWNGNPNTLVSALQNTHEK